MEREFDMIQVDHSKYNVKGNSRVRVEHGHNSYYKRLEREKATLEAELKALEEVEKPNKRDITSKQKLISSVQTKLLQLREEHGVPPGKKFYAARYSFNVENEEQGRYVEALFIEKQTYHSEGKKVPSELEERINSIKQAPSKSDYLAFLAGILIDLSGYHLEQDMNMIYSVPEDIFHDQSNISADYIDYYQITHQDIIEEAIDMIENPVVVNLKNKKFIFTAAFNSYTTIDTFAKLLYNLAKRHKVDGIITVGPWSKTIFLHKNSATNKINESVRNIIKDFNVYALRSNLEVAESIPELRALGVTFVDSIEDEKNVFYGWKLSHASTKNQLNRYKDLDKSKNLFVYTSYVASETFLYQDNIFNILGSGISSVNLPRSRRTTASYDSQLLNSTKYDSTGGHLLTFDEDSNVHFTSFHYNRELKSILINGERIEETYSATPKKCDISVIVSDVHVQHMNKNCFKALLDFLHKEKSRIKRFVINGDFFDNAVLSHWNKNKIDVQVADSKRLPTFLHEVAYAKEVLRLITSRLNPNTQLIYKMGNHEVNSLNAMKAQSLTHFLSNILDLETLLDLKGFGFEVIDSRKSYDVAGITLFHGHEMNEIKGRQMFGRKNAKGHFHRCSLTNTGVVLPSFQDADSADYMPYYKQSWVSGWSVITESEGIGDKPQFILLSEDGIYQDFDSLRNVNDIPDVPIEIEDKISITFNL